MVWPMLMLSVLVSCEKMVVDEDGGASAKPAVEAGANLILRVVADGTRTDGLPWTTLNIVVYQTGQKVKAVTQHSGDEGFGEVGMKLDAGTYQVMVLAHSSAANPTLSDPTNVKFTNADGFSDTFGAYRTVEVTETPGTHEIRVERLTAMVRFKTKDVKPAEAKQARFYYVGGSGAINVTTGLGVDKSKQNVFVDLPDALTGKTLQFDLYTFPREEEGTLELTVNMLDAAGGLLKYPGGDEGSRTFSNIPIKRNRITECSGYFFTDGTGGIDIGDDYDETDESFVIIVNTDWDGTVPYDF